MNKWLGSSLLAMVVLLGGCSTVDKVGGWVGLGSKTPVLPPPPEAVVGLGVEVVWSGSSGSYTGRFMPALTETGPLYVAAQDGTVRALEAATGREIWSQRIKPGLTTGVAANTEWVVVGNGDGEVVALASGDGSERWRVPLRSALLSPVRLLSDGVLVQAADDTVYYLAARDGQIRWQAAFASPPLSLHGTSTPWTDGQLALVGLANGKLVALELATGRVRWEIPVARPTGRSEIERLVDIDADPQADRGAAYAVSYHGGLVAVAMADGGPIWRRDWASIAGFTIAGNVLYLSSREGQVVALDARNGVALWQQDKLKKRSPSTPVVVGSHVAVADSEGQIYWLRTEDGELVARYNFDGANSHPVLQAIGNQVLAQSAKGRLALLALKP